MKHNATELLAALQHPRQIRNENAFFKQLDSWTSAASKEKDRDLLRQIQKQLNYYPHQTAEFQVLRGKLAEKMGQMDDALKFYQKARNEDKTFYTAYLCQAQLLLQLKRFTEARYAVKDMLFVHQQVHFDRARHLKPAQKEQGLKLLDKIRQQMKAAAKPKFNPTIIEDYQVATATPAVAVMTAPRRGFVSGLVHSVAGWFHHSHPVSRPVVGPAPLRPAKRPGCNIV